MKLDEVLCNFEKYRTLVERKKPNTSIECQTHFIGDVVEAKTISELKKQLEDKNRINEEIRSEVERKDKIINNINSKLYMRFQCKIHIFRPDWDVSGAD